MHVEVRRLFDAASGAIQLNADEAEHLRACQECKEVLRSFTRQINDVSSPPKKKAR